jgi:hypothetical protein
MEECTAAKEAATVLAEALVYTRPNELEHKPIIAVSELTCTTHVEADHAGVLPEMLPST